jgi:cell wall-associated NlpC family hydrolase
MLRVAVLRPALIAATVVAALTVPLGTTALAEDTAPPAAPAPAAVPTALRITTPSSVPAGSNADVWVRLVQTAQGGEEGVGNVSVLIQRQSSNGWAQVAEVTTRADGLAHGPVTIGSTARFRAFFRGDAGHETSTSREVVITATTRNGLGDKAVAEAKRHRGAPYSYGAAGPGRFDCSGLTRYVFSRLGKSLPHSSSAQAQSTRRVANSAKKPGDLIFTYHGSTVGHVGIYAGGSQMWAAVKAGDVVRLQSFSGRTYRVGRVG